MKVPFLKYEGTGNDFILIDIRNRDFKPPKPAFIEKSCHRRFGIGADGIIFLKERAGYDFEMVYYNADGKPGSMCGNGGRCIVAFAKHLNIIGSETNFLAADGCHYAKISADGTFVSLQMIDVDTVASGLGGAFILNTGSPHYVLQVQNLENKNVYEDGRMIRYNNTYAKEGINVNFVEDMGDHYFVRTYERGVEDETYACGTGVTAVAIAMAKQKKQTGYVNTSVRVLGGRLNVHFNTDEVHYTNVFLEGPATFVFEGVITI